VQLGSHSISPSAPANRNAAASAIGMVWGMVASVALYRLYFRVRPMIALNKGAAA
jgi:hypothetical protein